MGEFAQLGIGGCFCLGVLKLVFDFLERRDRKRHEEDRGSLNGDSPEHRTADALERIADKLDEQCQLTAANGTKLDVMHAKLDMLRN